MRQRLCLSLALWNGRDAILKERLFGLTNGEGNHGEDVKEQYYYLDATPTHSYLKMLYKYPQSAFPYSDLVEENRRRGIGAPGVSSSPTRPLSRTTATSMCSSSTRRPQPGDVLMKVTAHNRGPEAAPLHLIPQLGLAQHLVLGYRGAETQPHAGNGRRHSSASTPKSARAISIWKSTPRGCSRKTSRTRPSSGDPASGGFFKDAFHERIVGGRVEAVNTAGVGTKVGAWHPLEVPADSKVEVRMRLMREAVAFAVRAVRLAICSVRKSEADEFLCRIAAGHEIG